VGLSLVAVIGAGLAPQTYEAFQRLYPLETELIQPRRSGESGWFPLENLEVGIGLENPINQHKLGQILFSPKRISQTEILFSYGPTRFGCQNGPLEAIPFLTIVRRTKQLGELIRRRRWKGARATRCEVRGSR
jgi:hypothetical protein